MPTPLDVLHQTYGYRAFRERQKDVIDHVMAGRHAFVLMPTGGGKSLCYQIPALCRPGVGVVVSPLIALMQDQITALRELGVRAAAFHSALPQTDKARVLEDLRHGRLDLLYAAPERLLMPDFLAILDRVPLALFAIDEAHCLSQWGHDFRPEYRKLEVLAEKFPDVPRIALTATADAPTRHEIIEHLRIDPDGVFITGFDRPNIHYSIAEKDNPHQQLITFLEPRRGQSGIVYRLSRQKTEDTAAFLAKRGYTALPYHAGMDNSDRQAHQQRFLYEDSIVMVATIAFGMGIDKPDVRFVAHLDLPRSIEAYYQETGRAGRDGLPAHALMLYGWQDIALQRHFIEQTHTPDAQKRIERQKLDALLGLCETARCRRQVLLAYFGDQCEPCGRCDTCDQPPELFDGSLDAQKLLSCVYRTGQRFGQGHVIDVLLGMENERVQRLGHRHLSTWGIGKDRTRREWQSLLRQIIAHGLLDVDIAGHGGLSISEAGRQFLRDRTVLMLRAGKSPTGKRKPRPGPTEAVSNRPLFEALRRKRTELARALGLPPYIIFHDRTLVELAESRPTTLAEFARINGVGAAKLEHYGQAFLDVIRCHGEVADGATP